MSRRSTFKETLDYFRELEVSKFWITVLVVIAFFVGRNNGLEKREAALYTGYIGGYCEAWYSAASITELPNPEAYDSTVQDVEGDPITTYEAQFQIGNELVAMDQLFYPIDELPRRKSVQPLPTTGPYKFPYSTTPNSFFVDLGKKACAYGFNPLNNSSEDILTEWKW